MTDRRPAVALACKPEVRAAVAREPQIERLRQIADFRVGDFDRPADYVEAPPPDADADRRLIELVGDADALIVSMGAPRVTGEIMDACPNLRFIGELEGDRFAQPHRHRGRVAAGHPDGRHDQWLVVRRRGVGPGPDAGRAP